MNCKKCGSPLLPNETYCQKCGEKVESVVNSTVGATNVVNTPEQPQVQVTPTQVVQNVQPQVVPQTSVQQSNVTPVTPVQVAVEPQVSSASQAQVTPQVQSQPTATPQGEQANVNGMVPPQEPNVGVQSTPKKSNKVFIVIVIVLIAAIMGLGAFIITNLTTTTKNTKTNATTTTVASDEEETTETTTTTTTARVTSKVTTTVTTTNSALTSNIVSFGTYDYTIPSGFKYQIQGNELYFWNSNETFIASILRQSIDYTIDEVIASAEYIKTNMNASDYAVKELGTTKIILFELSNKIIWYAGTQDGKVIAGGIFLTPSSETEMLDCLNSYAAIIESASPNGSGSFASITSEEDLIVSPDEYPFE